MYWVVGASADFQKGVRDNFPYYFYMEIVPGTFFVIIHEIPFK